MRLVSIAGGAQGRAGAVLRGGEIVDLRHAARKGTIETWLPDSVTAILAGGRDGIELVQNVVARVESLEGEARVNARRAGTILNADTPLLSPIPNPSLLLAAGLAYKSHLAEMAGTPTPPHPTAFMKSPTSICGSGVTVRLPQVAMERVDYEGELAVVFGRHCHCVSATDALDYVAGYMIANDFSARDWVQAAWNARSPWEARLTWEVNIMGKQFPGFSALGPVLLTADEMPDPGACRVRTRVNNTLVQDAPVSDLIFSLSETIAHFSRWYLFTPGDILLTGTPAGVGVGRKPPLFLKAGDRVEVEIDPIGTLSNMMG